MFMGVVMSRVETHSFIYSACARITMCPLLKQ